MRPTLLAADLSAFVPAFNSLVLDSRRELAVQSMPPWKLARRIWDLADAAETMIAEAGPLSDWQREDFGYARDLACVPLTRACALTLIRRAVANALVAGQ